MIIARCRVGVTTILDGKRVIYRRISPRKGGVTTSALLRALRIEDMGPGDYFIRVQDYIRAVEYIQEIERIDLRHVGAKEALSSLWNLLNENVCEAERL